MEEIEEEIAEIKSHSDVFSINPPGLKILAMKVQQIRSNKKADLILNSLKPE